MRTCIVCDRRIHTCVRSVNPKSTSNQSSKPCTVLQYPSKKNNVLYVIGVPYTYVCTCVRVYVYAYQTGKGLDQPK